MQVKKQYSVYFPTTPQVSVALYTDDSAIASKHQQPAIISWRLQEHIDLNNDWFINWKIKIHTRESQTIPLQKRTLTSVDPPTIDGDIPWSTHVKYLDIIMDRELMC